MLENNYTTEKLTFPVTITSKFQKQAEKFRRQQSHPAKGEQVYRNTLAVLAVDFYCQCMGIETDLTASDSWNPVMQTLTDAADLTIKGFGKLECRPVLSGTNIVEVPVEVMRDRIGYIAVQFSESMQDAELIGFVEEVTTEDIPLEQWKSLEYFLEFISEPEVVKVDLRKWLEGIVDAGWDMVEKIESLLSPSEPQLSFNFRSVATPKYRKVENSAIGAKLLQLEKAGEQMAIFVGATASETEFDILSSADSEPEIDIFVELYAVKPQIYLPQDLQLIVLDDQGKLMLQTVANSSKNIRLEFSGYPGEEFSVKLALGDFSIMQGFQL
ncbi:hypothetical protein BCD67_09765 [Oscillatoriales cyanobacterium USR001]|nr:hypothetical protein BCD67_09765 [Oscillatoriales cyanobacterium USR001]